MRLLVSICISLLIVIGNSHIPISMHFCKGNLAQVNLQFQSKGNSCCGTTDSSVPGPKFGTYCCEYLALDIGIDVDLSIDQVTSMVQLYAIPSASHILQIPDAIPSFNGVIGPSRAPPPSRWNSQAWLQTFLI